jgi:allantoicase/2-oxo-4-hydroxy-4-carboxy--5-ureidoimidazoline (OHCU) decarboxylase
MNKTFEIPYYHDYISPKIFEKLKKDAKKFPGIDGLLHVGESGGAENFESMNFLCELYNETKAELKKVLAQRIIDRKFIDERTKSCYQFNQKLKNDFLSPNYKTILGHEDAKGRIVIGPKHDYYAKPGPKKLISPIPEFLQGNHVTLFGPPDNAKLSINAMNAYHRKLKNEPPVVEELLSTHIGNPKWGADDEDSKTPMREDLISAEVNLTKCFNQTLSVQDENNGKRYELAKDHLSLPIKRFPGLALPSFFLFYHNNPIPLHLYDFALHLFHHWNQHEALCFYVPKLENEEEARYIKFMVEVAENLIQKLHPTYKVGTIRLLIVLENPRAILRTHEMIDELYPYFAGASLGWHDYLGSTARLFKEDGNYRIPVKADPNIVIKYIKASHNLLANVVGPRGGIKIGGMYGILPITTDLFSDSFQITIIGFIKDVITQMKRDLTGFWVAHPDFVRIGMALVEAWKFHQKGDSKKLETLCQGLLLEKFHSEIIKFIHSPDIEGLNIDDPMYVRSLLVADIKESTYIANNHPDEIRYNVFQSLQYLTDWLSGNGCVALPAQISGTPVRVMDDLATAERSRWEVWHEIYHGRFDLYEFLKIAHEEFHFIRKDLSDNKKIVQVKWDERTSLWYPVALKLMIRLMTDIKPVEFASELLLPFTMATVRISLDPWQSVLEIDEDKYNLNEEIVRFNYYFERCGCFDFAKKHSQNLIMNLTQVEADINSFTKMQIIEAASFHGDIGSGKKTLDKMAASEQAQVFTGQDVDLQNLNILGTDYLKKFGVKFLVSAKGKSASDLLGLLKRRINGTEEQELTNARHALWEITQKRLNEEPINQLSKLIYDLKLKYKVQGAQIAISTTLNKFQSYSLGPVTDNTWFELASLSKTLACAFSLDYLKEKNISEDDLVNNVFSQTKSAFRLKGPWGDKVKIADLMGHTALNLHYIMGYPLGTNMPKNSDLLVNVEVINPPGEKFQYSGGGFLVLEHLIESLSEKNICDLTKNYFSGFSFDQSNIAGIDYAKGYHLDGTEVKSTRLMFPSFAAGAMGSSLGFLHFLNELNLSYHNLNIKNIISHDTAVKMLHGKDRGCMEFMGLKMGLGVFTTNIAGNLLAIHQGANDGFRAIYIYCISGPNRGAGFVIQASGELNAVLFISEVSQLLLKELNIAGIDFSKFKTNFSADKISQEQIVNMGYKNLIFDAFIKSRAEEIIIKGDLDPLSKVNLVVGSKVVSVTNDLFARAENLISSYLPTFDPELFGSQGKIMDSWESVRHNPLDLDELVLELKQKSEINFVSLSTKFHHGNQAPVVMIHGREKISDSWDLILDKTNLEGHACKTLATIKNNKKYLYIKVSMIPDGGLTRLGLYEKQDGLELKSFIFPDKIPTTNKPLNIFYKPSEIEIKNNLMQIKTGEELNLASLAYGAKLIKASNEHYGPAIQVISPFSPINMFDGLESARSRIKDHFEEVIIELAHASKIHRIEMDFTFFVNNNPLFVSIEGFTSDSWKPLVQKTNVKAFAGNTKQFKIHSELMYSQIRVLTIPDGGMNRLRVFGFK